MSGFIKVLSRTDVGMNSSHQTGVLIPQTVRGQLPRRSQLDVSIHNGRRWVKTTANLRKHTRFGMRTAETHLTGLRPLMTADAGDIMVVERDGDELLLSVVGRNSRRARALYRDLSGRRSAVLD